MSLKRIINITLKFITACLYIGYIFLFVIDFLWHKVWIKISELKVKAYENKTTFFVNRNNRILRIL